MKDRCQFLCAPFELWFQDFLLEFPAMGIDVEFLCIGLLLQNSDEVLEFFQIVILLQGGLVGEVIDLRPDLPFQPFEEAPYLPLLLLVQVDHPLCEECQEVVHDVALLLFSEEVPFFVLREAILDKGENWKHVSGCEIIIVEFFSFVEEGLAAGVGGGEVDG